MWNVPEDERITVTSENFADLLIASAKEALALSGARWLRHHLPVRSLPIQEAV